MSLEHAIFIALDKEEFKPLALQLFNEVELNDFLNEPEEEIVHKFNLVYDLGFVIMPTVDEIADTIIPGDLLYEKREDMIEIKFTAAHEDEEINFDGMTEAEWYESHLDDGCGKCHDIARDLSHELPEVLIKELEFYASELADPARMILENPMNYLYEFVLGIEIDGEQRQAIIEIDTILDIPANFEAMDIVQDTSLIIGEYIAGQLPQSLRDEVTITPKDGPAERIVIKSRWLYFLLNYGRKMSAEKLEQYLVQMIQPTITQKDVYKYCRSKYEVSISTVSENFTYLNRVFADFPA